MARITENITTLAAQTLEERLLVVFNGGDGFGKILFFWALMLSMLGLVVLLAIGFAFQSGIAVLGGLAAGRCYFYLGHIGKDILADVFLIDG